MQKCTEKEGLQMLESDIHLERAVGLAVFNAINSRVERNVDDTEAIAKLEIQQTDHVVIFALNTPICNMLFFGLN